MSDVVAFADRRIRQRIEEQVAQLRATGWIVNVERDCGDALIVCALDGEGQSLSLWIDPAGRYAKMRELMRDLGPNLDAAGGKLAIDPHDEAAIELMRFLAGKVQR